MRKLVSTGLLATLVFLAACSAAAPGPAAEPAPAKPAADLDGIKTYLIDQATALKAGSGTLKAQTDRYYALAEAHGFDYARLWQDQQDQVTAVIEAARDAWIQASPLYEKMEGIVAGTPELARYDVILDAGASGDDDPANAVPFDLSLPDGRVLSQPGNLFGVTESTLWGTYPAYTAGIDADWDGDGSLAFGETLPDAGVLKAGADALDSYAGELLSSAQAWTPTPSEAFSALAVMVPTMSEYFASWRDSRFVAGSESSQRDFVAISRLADMDDILGGL
ncbi:MAG: imelysin family protein, partial [Anaerolineae bacterium]